MKIVMVGETNFGSRTPQRVRALERLGHDVKVVSTVPADWNYETPPSLATRIRHRLRIPADRALANAKLIEAAAHGADVVILDNAKAIAPHTLTRLRAMQPHHRLVWYSEDDMMNPAHRSRWVERSMPLFDLWVTTKSYNAAPHEIPAFGVGRIMVVDNSFDPIDHSPVPVSSQEQDEWGAPVGFVGTYEAPRADMIRTLAQHGVHVRIWGNGWQKALFNHPLIRVENVPVYGPQYQKVVASTAINLCFLRRGNRDRQTCRSVEIPAMGGFMAHEGSSEMAGILTPDQETVYFETAEDLLGVCRRWLADPEGRQKIADAGKMKIRRGGYSHDDRWRMILRATQEDYANRD